MPISQLATETAQLLEAQAPQYTRGRIDNTVRERIILYMLDEKGRITMNNRSMQFLWLEQFAQPTVRTAGTGSNFTFQQSTIDKQAGLDTGGYSSEDIWHYADYLKNGAEGGMIQYYSDKMPKLLEGLEDHFCGELYKDGNATGRDDAIHGFNSYLAYTAPTSSDMIALPNDDYAGLTTDLGDYGGSWSSDQAAADQPHSTLGTDWPNGNGDAAYDFHSPLILHAGTSRWGTSTNFYENAGVIFRHATTWLRKNGGAKGKPDLFCLGSNKWLDYTRYQQVYFNNNIPYDNKYRDLGFPDTMQQEGVTIAQDFDCPADEGHVLNFDYMELKSLDDVLWRTVGPHYDMNTDYFLYRVGFFGNLIVKGIKMQGKIVDS